MFTKKTQEEMGTLIVWQCYEVKVFIFCPLPVAITRQVLKSLYYTLHTMNYTQYRRNIRPAVVAWPLLHKEGSSRWFFVAFLAVLLYRTPFFNLAATVPGTRGTWFLVCTLYILLLLAGTVAHVLLMCTFSVSTHSQSFVP